MWVLCGHNVLTCCTCVGFDSGGDSKRMSNIPLFDLLNCGFMDHVVGFIIEILWFGRASDVDVSWMHAFILLLKSTSLFQIIIIIIIKSAQVVHVSKILNKDYMNL
jgi:hypothetical protein